MPDEGAEGGFDPLDIANPVSAYFFLSDDVQDEIGGGKEKDEMPVLRPQICWRILQQLPGVSEP